MKTSHVVILVLPIFMLFMLLSSVIMQKTVAYNTVNREYGTYVASAAADAAGFIENGTTGLSFDTKEKRDKVINEFYKSLITSIYEDNGLYESEIEHLTHLIILADVNGFYVYGNEEGDISYNTLTKQESTLLPYTSVDGGTIIKHTLSEELSVYKNKKYVTGSYEEVNKELNLYPDKSAYEKDRNIGVVSSIEKEINSLLQSKNFNAVPFKKGYSVTLPVGAGGDLSRLLAKPCIIAFVQGKSEEAYQKQFNIYAFAGGELSEPLLYLGDSNGLYYDTGTHDSGFGTMKEESLKYFPDVYANNGNY